MFCLQLWSDKLFLPVPSCRSSNCLLLGNVLRGLEKASENTDCNAWGVDKHPLIWLDMFWADGWANWPLEVHSNVNCSKIQWIWVIRGCVAILTCLYVFILRLALAFAGFTSATTSMFSRVSTFFFFFVQVPKQTSEDLFNKQTGKISSRALLPADETTEMLRALCPEPKLSQTLEKREPLGCRLWKISQLSLQ